MSTSLCTKPESFEPRDIASPGAFTRGLEGLLDRLLQRMRERRTYADLAGLDDRTLKDIGLDRGMLPGIAHHASLKPACKPRPVWAASRSWLFIREHGGRLLSGLIKLVFEARRRAALHDLRRFEASLGPNQLKEFGQRIADLPIHRPD